MTENRENRKMQSFLAIIQRYPWLIAVILSLTSPLSAADKIRVGFSAISMANAPVWIAEEKGLFKKNGIETEPIVIGGGAVVSAVFSGSDIVMVAAGNNKGIQRVMVKPEITTPAGLKGKRIGIT